MFDRKNWPFDLNELPSPTYLVGGWVRDRLLGRNSKHLDLDFVVTEAAIETARAIAHRHSAGFVVLDAERQIARVVFQNATADFARQIGNTLNEDLQRRDFCMNAIAIDCQHLAVSDGSPTASLIDPLDGWGDLQTKRVRMVAPENLLDDPLRLLRAYRQAAQLGFEIESLTHQALRQFAGNLAKVAAERVRTELIYLLGQKSGSQWLQTAVSDGILADWLPSTQLRLDRLSQMDIAIATLVNTWPQLEPYFASELSSDRPVAVVVKLAAMIAAATALEPLGFSRIEQRWIVGLLRSLPKLLSLLTGATPTEQYQLFEQAQEIFPALTGLALASGATPEAIAPWLDRWLDPRDAIAHAQALISGDDLKTALSLPSSPKIGELLIAVRLAQVEGIISNREEAIAYVRTLLGSEP